jgi:DnaJ family protein A protein 5
MEMKTCYYAVLGCELTASAAEIKKAYHKAALRWHPDKNVENLAEATEKFKEAHDAYAVLGDKQERAWYDGHRETILGGDDEVGAAGGDDEGGRRIRSSTLMKYFDASCYSNHDDAAGGFYEVYRSLFVRLDEEEEAEENLDTYHNALPGFGASGTAHAEVATFYREWSNFVTLKEFHSSEKYNPRDGPDRHARRAMEKENTKLRRKVRKDFMDTVHNLVSFIKKRDPRVVAMAAEVRPCLS